MYKIILAILLTASSAFAENLTASYYDSASLIREGTRKSGERQVMANGKIFDETKYTAASWDFPLNQRCKVSNLETGKSIILVVTDRTARRFKGKRIDLSKAAMFALGGQSALNKGLVKVNVEAI